MDNNKVYVFRLKPGEDLRKSIEAIVKEKITRSYNLSALWNTTNIRG